jgi:hypothetical protein
VGADDVEGFDLIFISAEINRADALGGIKIPGIASIGDDQEGAGDVIVGEGVEIGDGEEGGFGGFFAERVEEDSDAGRGGDGNHDHADGDGEDFLEKVATVGVGGDGGGCLCHRGGRFYERPGWRYKPRLGMLGERLLRKLIESFGELLINEPPSLCGA